METELYWGQNFHEIPFLVRYKLLIGFLINTLFFTIRMSFDDGSLKSQSIDFGFRLCLSYWKQQFSRTDLLGDDLLVSLLSS